MIVALLVLFSAIYCSYCANEDNPIQYDESYSLGVKAYYDYDWTNSVQLMKRSVSDYKETVNVREVCFERCQHLKTNSLPDYADDQELHFFHILNEHTICRETCKQKHSSQPLLREVNYEMEQSLTLGDVHNYIQMSLFKVNVIVLVNWLLSACTCLTIINYVTVYCDTVFVLLAITEWFV